MKMFQFIFLIAILVFIAVTAYSALAFDTTNFTAYYKFESNATPITDESGNYGGIINPNIYVYQETGKKDNAIRTKNFAVTNSYVNLSLQNAGLTGARCFSFWFKNYSDNALGKFIMADINEGTYARSIGLYGSISDTWNIRAGYAASAQWTHSFAWDRTTYRDVDRWQHVVISMNSSGVATWWNGTLINYGVPANYNVSTPVSDREFCIGAYLCNHVTAQYGGFVDIDEFLIMNRSCTPSDVSELWNSGTGTFYDDLFGTIKIGILNTTYNVTNAYKNHTLWRINQTFSIPTYNKTPEVKFTLNISGNCTISRYNWNYTAVKNNDSNFVCSTKGTTLQLCTYPYNLTYGKYWLYLACIKTDGTNETSNFSSSSALNISIENKVPYITYNEEDNFSQTVVQGQNISFDLSIQHNFSDSGVYNITFNGNNTNFTMFSNYSSVFINENSLNVTQIRINVSAVANYSTYLVNITLFRESDSTNYNFTVYLTIASTSALINFNDTLPWAETKTDADAFSKKYILNNTGNYDASSCQVSATGILNTYLTVNETNFNVAQGTVKEFSASFANIPAADYTISSYYLNAQCAGTSGGSLVYSNYIKLNFNISETPSVGGGVSAGGGGGAAPEVITEYLTETLLLFPDFFAKYVLDFFPFKYYNKTYTQSFSANKRMVSCNATGNVICVIDEKDTTKGYLYYTIFNQDKFIISINGTNTATAIDKTIGKQPFLFQVINWGYPLPFKAGIPAIEVKLLNDTRLSALLLGIAFLLILIIAYKVYV